LSKTVGTPETPETKTHLLVVKNELLLSLAWKLSQLLALILTTKTPRALRRATDYADGTDGCVVFWIEGTAGVEMASLTLAGER
jgi:hypothetical protein